MTTPPTTCACDEPFALSHEHCCKLAKRRGITERHDLITKTLYTTARTLGLNARMEIAQRDANNKKTIPDFQFYTHAGQIFSDVSVVCAYAKTNLAQSNPIHTREQQKSSKFEQTCLDNHGEFIPFVLDSLGRFGGAALRVVDLIVHQYFLIHPIDYHAPRTGRPTDSHSTLRKSLIDSISVQLQVGNGMVSAAMLAINRASQGSGPPRTPHPLPQHQPRMLHPAIRTAAADPNRVPPPRPIFKHNTLRQPPAAPRHIPSIIASHNIIHVLHESKEEKRSGPAPPQPSTSTRDSDNHTISYSPSSSSSTAVGGGPASAGSTVPTPSGHHPDDAVPPTAPHPLPPLLVSPSGARPAVLTSTTKNDKASPTPSTSIIGCSANSNTSAAPPSVRLPGTDHSPAPHPPHRPSVILTGAEPSADLTYPIDRHSNHSGRATRMASSTASSPPTTPGTTFLRSLRQALDQGPTPVAAASTATTTTTTTSTTTTTAAPTLGQQLMRTFYDHGNDGGDDDGDADADAH